MSEIQYNTETKRGWRIILIDENGTDILHGYARDKAEEHAKKVIHRWNAFEDGGIVDELRKACEGFMKAWITPEARSMDKLRTDMDNAYQEAKAAIEKAKP